MFLLSGITVLLLSVSPLRAETVFPSGFCDRLSKPAPEKIAPYITLAPELDGAKSVIREVTLADIDPILTEAVSRGWTAVDFFSEDAIRGRCLYFISQEVLEQVNRKFDLKVMTRIKGTDVDNRAYQMTAMFTGLSNNFIFYDRDNIAIKDGDNRVKLKQKVREQVTGPGKFVVSGMSVYVSQVDSWWDIKKTDKISANQMNITVGPPSVPQLNITQTVPLSPMVLRPAASDKKKSSALSPSIFGKDFNFYSKRLDGAIANLFSVKH